MNESDHYLVKGLLKSQFTNLKTTAQIRTVNKWTEETLSNWFKSTVTIFWHKYVIYNHKFSPINENLSSDQVHALNFALYRRNLAIIQGPPGTGKTKLVHDDYLFIHSLTHSFLRQELSWRPSFKFYASSLRHASYYAPLPILPQIPLLSDFVLT